jgi:hypothetical protein
MTQALINLAIMLWPIWAMMAFLIVEPFISKE